MVKAVVCHSMSESMAVQDVPSQALGIGQVRIQTKACGINFPDLLMTTGRYHVKPEPPFTPGFEAAGMLSEVAPDVTGWKTGDRVMLRTWYGCYSEEIVAQADSLLPLPNGFSFEEGATFVLATSTAVNAVMQRGQLQAGEFLLVHGSAGGVGLAAVEVGKLLGATVIATASTDEKLDIARSRGADHCINYAREDFVEAVQRITGGNGADVILDPVGGDVFNRSLRCVAWGGRILIVGFAGGEIPVVKMNQALLKCCSLVGVRALEHLKRNPKEGAEYVRKMMEWANAGRLRPYISHRLPMHRFQEALDLVSGRKAIGRVVVTVD